MKAETVGFTENYRRNARCDRCDVPLYLRTWKDRNFVLSTSKNRQHGFLCVKCVSSSKIGRTFYRTKEQLNEFVRKI